MSLKIFSIIFVLLFIPIIFVSASEVITFGIGGEPYISEAWAFEGIGVDEIYICYTEDVDPVIG